MGLVLLNQVAVTVPSRGQVSVDELWRRVETAALGVHLGKKGDKTATEAAAVAALQERIYYSHSFPPLGP